MGNSLKGVKIDADKLARAKEFMKRSDAGELSGEDALRGYSLVAKNLTPDQLEEVTTESLSQLPDSDREQVADWMRSVGGETYSNLTADPKSLAAASRTLGASQGSGIDGLLGGLLGGLAGGGSQGGGGGLEDLLGGLLGGASGGGSQGSGGAGLDDLLGGLLGGASGGSQGGGGGIGDLLGGLLGGASGGGQQGQSGGGGLGGFLSNPIVISVLGGIASKAMGKVVGDGAKDEDAGGFASSLGGLLAPDAADDKPASAKNVI